MVQQILLELINMKYIKFTFFFILLLSISSNVYAAKGKASVYKVTMKEAALALARDQNYL